jgi:pimeloyl-ACP methyl ester carboxylesterase
MGLLACAAASAMTPADLDRFEAQKNLVSLANGERLAYLDLGRKDAPALVLIHGYTDSARDWLPVVPLLDTRFRLIIVDLRGHGRSDKPECCYTRFDFAYDVKLLLDALSIKRANIAGHSLGSLVAQTLAELWPSLTERLILISSTGTSFDPAASLGATAATDWMQGVDALTDPIEPNSKFMRDWWHQSILINPQFFVERQERDAAAIPAHVWKAIGDQCIREADLGSMLKRVHAPTLIVWGSEDTLADAAGREALRKGIPKAQVRDFPRLGHDLFWQDPGAVAALMTQFLESAP